MRTARLAGHYFILLGVSGLLWMVVGPILGESLHLDCGVLLFLWVGVGLLNARNGRRKLATVMTSLVVVLSLGYLIYLQWAAGPVSSRAELRTPLLAAFHAGLILLLFLTPLVLLLLPGTRRWFAEHRESPPPRYVPTGRTFALYGLAVGALIAGSVAFEGATQTAKPSGWTTSFSYGENKSGIVASRWMEDEATNRTLYVSWLAFAETNSYGSSTDGHVTFGSHQVSVPVDKPIRYLISPPKIDESRGNVLIVRQDGTVIRLPRRVTHAQLESVRNAVDGVRDFEELRERLEDFLPLAGATASK